MVTSYDVARQLVTDSGGNPNDKGIVRAIAIWIAYESGTRILSNNPWNLRPGHDYSTCSRGTDNKGFTVFCTWQDGVKATSQRLSKDDYRGYRPVYDAIRQGRPLAFFAALARSKWSSDHYGGGGKFVTAFNSATNYERALTFGARNNSPVGDTPAPGSPRSVDPPSAPVGAPRVIASGIDAATDPGNIVRILALLAGVAIAGFGAWQLLRSSAVSRA